MQIGSIMGSSSAGRLRASQVKPTNADAPAQLNSFIKVLQSREQIDCDKVVLRLPFNQKNDHKFTGVRALLAPWMPRKVHVRGPQSGLDFIGDIHGCCDELEDLMSHLGYTISWNRDKSVCMPHIKTSGRRKLVLVGDLVDRGPRVVDTLRIAKSIVAHKLGYVILGNHDLRLMRFLSGRAVEYRSGIGSSIDQLSVAMRTEVAGFVAFLRKCPSAIIFDHEKIHASHTGLDAVGHTNDANELHMQAVRGKFIERGAWETLTESQFQSGEKLLSEPPIHWTKAYRGKNSVIYGHYQVCDANWVNNTICIDTGCVYGGRLSALRWPENEIQDLKSREVYHADRGSSRPLPMGQVCFKSPGE